MEVDRLRSENDTVIAKDGLWGCLSWDAKLPQALASFFFLGCVCVCVVGA